MCRLSADPIALSRHYIFVKRCCIISCVCGVSAMCGVFCTQPTLVWGTSFWEGLLRRQLLVCHLAEELDADEADFEFVVVVTEVFHGVDEGV